MRKHDPGIKRNFLFVAACWIFFAAIISGCATTMGGDQSIYNEAEVRVSQKSLYPNEEYVLLYQLFTRVDLRYEGFKENPHYSYQWFEERSVEDMGLKTEVVKRDGLRKVSAKVKEIALFPMKSGTFTIEPGALQVAYPIPGSTERKQDEIATQPFTINVKPFPDQGKTNDFNGFTGNFSMSTKAEKVKKADGEYINYHVEIKGRGNIRQLPLPALEFSKSLETIEVKTKVDLHWLKDGLNGVKTFDLVLRPDMKGKIQLPPAHFSYFDPSKLTYISILGESYEFTIQDAPSPSPKSGGITISNKDKLIILIDVSGSMLALDFQPKDRLSIAKDAVSKLISSNKMKEKMIGLKMFAKEVQDVKPLSDTQKDFEQIFKTIEVGKLPDGTAIGDALFEASNEIQTVSGKGRSSILLITDGGSTAGQIDPITAAEMAAEKSINIYSIVIGKGGKVPFRVQDKDFGDKIIEAEVKVDESTIKKIAEITAAKYYRVKNIDEFDSAVQELENVI